MRGNVITPPYLSPSLQQSKGNYDITLTYLEIYNENIRDLLSGKPEFLELRDDGHKGVVVSGITSVRVTSTEQVLSFLKKGNRNRTIEATGANEVSSRSHAVLQVGGRKLEGGRRGEIEVTLFIYYRLLPLP